IKKIKALLLGCVHGDTPRLMPRLARSSKYLRWMSKGEFYLFCRRAASFNKSFKRNKNSWLSLRDFNQPFLSA
ncbi:hypothetical protein L2735_15660, partial [Shewanella olleyana]|uniref:hypothetical protein n=1 Tax=Shewanella olleyana TaxID=135626 RepID=UPI00200E8B7A